MVETKTPAEHKRKRQRSPSYPGIGLKTALERALVMFREEGRTSVAVDAILHDWGYKPGSGSGLVALAALKKFGLLVESGSGKARQGRLSEEGLKIVLDERPVSPERDRLIQEAALKPTIHRELWEKYGGTLPSDASLRHELLVERAFTEAAVGEFIPQLRETVEFAKLTGAAKLPQHEVDKKTGTPSDAMIFEPSGEAAKNVRAMHLPVAPDEYATLQAAFPLTETKWSQMLAVLEAMKPALVVNAPTDEEPKSSDEKKPAES